jgi:hypothetical protein
MARALIGILNEDKTLDYVSVRDYGEPDFILPILKKSYNTEVKVRNLVNLGSISGLAPDGELVSEENEARKAGSLSNFEKKAGHGWAEYIYWYNKDSGWWNHKQL